MKLYNKVISVVSALAMLMSLSTFTAVNAKVVEGPVMTTVVTSGAPITEGEELTVDVNISGVSDGKVAGVQLTFPVDSAMFDVEELSKTTGSDLVNITAGEIFDGADMNVADSEVLFTFSTNAKKAIAVADGSTVLSIKLKPLVTQTTPVELGDLSVCIVITYPGENNTTDKVEYDLDNGEVIVKPATVYPALADDDLEITADDEVYTGKSVNLTAVIDAAKLGDRTLTWSDNVTVDPEDQTKAVLTPEKDGEVTVTVTVDDNGTPKVFTQTFTATTKIEPLVYEIITDEVTEEGVDVRVVLNDEYEGEGENPDYTLVAQFYAEDGTVLNWLSQDGDAISDVAPGEYYVSDGGETEGEVNLSNGRHTFEMEGAAYVRVTAYAKGTNTVIGQEVDYLR